MDRIIEILTEINDEIDYANHQALVDDGVLHSIDIISIITALSDEYDILIPPEEIIPENFNSAATLYAMVQRLLEE